ncbi:hypothetical protein H5410_032506 [Solanum commersonii]|uniref:Uncharacterized protein n=1 Tax=Solanum commersonii TaxID=4109 RepID=A0A9J5YN39_SOLCO|nr:hypothetical protein H5410_032506 [Solanum commersonii]
MAPNFEDSRHIVSTSQNVQKKGVSSSAYNVTGESEDGLRSRSNDGVRSNASDTGSGQLRCDREVTIPHQNQLESCTLTREQYNQVLQFLDKKLKVSHCVNVVEISSIHRQIAPAERATKSPFVSHSIFSLVIYNLSMPTKEFVT